MYLVFDIGTSAVKGALIREDGKLIEDARAPVGLYQGAEETAWEAEPMEWLTAIAACSQRLLGASGRAPRAVAISGNGPTLVPADAEGNPIGRAISWMDRRARGQVDRVSGLLGFPLDPTFYLPKALWYSEHRPEDFARTSRFFSCPEWVAYRLCGEARSYLADPYYERYTWATEIAETLGLSRSLFPAYVKPGEILGSVHPLAQEAFGIPAGTPVISAFPDFLASILGSGAVEPGLACDRAGTSEAFNLCAERPCPDWSLLSLPHAISGLWNISGGLSTSGKALDWYSRVAGYGLCGENGSEELFQDAQASKPKSQGLVFLPFLAGERAPLWRRELRGAFIGFSAEHDRTDLARAVAESIGLGLRLTSESLVAHGYAPRLVRVSGAPARNDYLNRLKASILSLPVEVPELTDCELAGDAAACAVALGDHDSLANAAAALVRIAKRFEPDIHDKPRYDWLFSVFSDAVAAVLPLSERLAEPSKKVGG